MSDVTDTTFDGIFAAARLGEEWAVAAIWRDPPRHRFYGSLSLAAAWRIWLRMSARVASRLGQFAGDRAFLRWTFTICRRRVIDAGRREARRRTVPSRRVLDFTHPRSTANSPGASRSTPPCTPVRLPRDQAEVILLRVVVGLDADSVGEILGRRPGTVRVLQHRGLERLAAVLVDERVTKPEACTILETDESLSA